MATSQTALQLTEAHSSQSPLSPYSTADLATDQSLATLEAPEAPCDAAQPQWQLQKLTPRHKQVAALVAQGMQYVKIASIVEMTPEYVSMLMRQPLMKAQVAELSEIAGTKIEALFEKSVDVIAEVLTTGSASDKLKAARLQMEATHRVGRPDPSARIVEDSVGRLETLAQRLLGLQSQVRQGRTFNEDGQEITDA